jgi:xanthine dehydrogenase molybdenum-binding subunit
MAYDLIGKNFTPPDVRAKVTGGAKYSEDFRLDGMVFCRLLTSPMPHARVVSIDASEALAMDGVVGLLTADEVPSFESLEDPILTNEPKYVGEPILAIAAVDETTAQDALEKVRLELESLPFVLNPLDSLYPGGPNARVEGNVGAGGVDLQTLKWSAADFAAVEAGQLPAGRAANEWSYGDVEAGFAAAALVLDETFVTATNAHHCMEPRTAMAYWQGGKCYLHASSQSQASPVPGVCRYLGIEQQDLVFIAEFCGGGFGSKASAYPSQAIPALMSRKIGRPVMMRISRVEEYFVGSARPGFQGRIRMGFASDGRITAVDLYIVQDNGANEGGGDWNAAADAVSLVYTPPAMRYRGVPVLTNTPAKGPQRGPGQNQIACAIEPILDKAAAELGVDRFAIRRINAPDNDTRFGGRREGVTSAHLREALDAGAEQFEWERKRQLSGRRTGSKVIGVGIGQAYHSAGRSGYDGLVRITPDGLLHIHTGVGNLGTYSHSATSRIPAEILKYDWQRCIVVRGDSSRHLSWTPNQSGSNTSYTMTRAKYVAAMDALQKIKEIAATDLGGMPDDYDIEDEQVFRIDTPEERMSFADVARRAIELGGRYSGHEAPSDINEMTRRSVEALAGTGLIGVARDNLDKVGTVPALAAGFMMIELDTETGKYEILEFVSAADCGTVLHPQGLESQMRGGAVMGIGLAGLERHVYDAQNGLPASVSLNAAKPPSYLDATPPMTTLAVNIADPQNPVGAKGVGEPLEGCSASALLSAISDALRGYYFNRVPVTTDMIVNAAAGRSQSYGPLHVNSF